MVRDPYAVCCGRGEPARALPIPIGKESMKKKLIICVPSVLAVLVCAAWCVLAIVRMRTEASLSASWHSFSDQHDILDQYGPESAHIWMEMMMLAYARSLEDHLKHPLAPWWPRATISRGSHAGVGTPHLTRRERLEQIQNDRETFARSIGVTNIQDEADLYTRFIDSLTQRQQEGQQPDGAVTQESARSAAPCSLALMGSCDSVE